MDGWNAMDGWMGWIDGWKDDGWNGMDRWMDGWKDGWIATFEIYICQRTSLPYESVDCLTKCLTSWHLGSAWVANVRNAINCCLF